MKKILSTLLVAAMLLSLVIVAAVPAAAVDGEWAVYAPASQYADGYDGDPKSVAGYEYTDDGLHTIPADWAKAAQSPWVQVETKEKVDLKEGVYFQVRVDDFSYDAGDQWFNINIWDNAQIEPPVAGFGEGVQNLIRANGGNASSVAWYTENFTSGGSSAMVAEQNQKTEDGKIVLTLTVTWDGTTYAANINGAAAPEKVITYMNQKWGGNDSEAYIGIVGQNNKTGGTCEFTVLKFGTSADDATVPMGDDSREPIYNSAEKAPIADPDTVPANTPAILMNGNKTDSDLKSTPKPASNTTLTINDDYTLHVVANQATADTGVWYVKNDVSYAIEDFPVGIVLMKNFCTCGSEDGTCYALESVSVYMLAGDVQAPDPNYCIKELSMCYDSYTIGDDTYLYFFVDMTTDAAKEMTGRIHGARYDVAGVDISTPGANAFDLLYMAWFRSVEEAEAYVQNTMKELGWSDAEDTTEAPTEVQTEATTEATDVTTEAPKGEQTTEAPKGEQTTEAPDEGGCGSVVGFGAIAIVAVAAVAGMVSFKKKED